MPDNESFTVKDYDRIINDVMDDFFAQQDMNFDKKELIKAQILGSEEELNIEEVNL